MGKRGGGRRRKRASQWADAAANERSSGSDHRPGEAKKPKVDDETPAKEAGQSHDTVDCVEVSLVGDDASKASNGLPAPFAFEGDSTMEVAADPAQSDLYKSLHSVWKYLGNINKKGTQWKPSPIQRHLWSILLESNWNTIGLASTGSGKTLAYAIPTVLSGGSVLVLVPTRELVHQVTKVFQTVSKAIQYYKRQRDETKGNNAPFPVVSIHGGTGRSQQQEALEDAATAEKCIVVATPGRLLDFLNDQEAPTRLLPLFQWIVLDEADQLAKNGDLGPQVDEILETTLIKPSSTKSADNTITSRLVLVSATYPERVRSKYQAWVGGTHVLVQADHVVQQATEKSTAAAAVATTTTTKENDEKVSKATSESLSSSTSAPQSDAGSNDINDNNNNNNKNAGSFARIPPHLEQVLHVCAEHKKPRKLLNTLQQIYKKHPNQRSRPLGIVFFSKIEKLKHIFKLLEKEGITGSVPLHSQLPSTNIRQMNLDLFSCGQKPLLLATDLAARGIDIPSVQFVIQYDFPGNLQQYVHRCGRAGRSPSISDQNPKPTIYSFFTRNLQAMAPDLVQLLEANHAWVDPNLRALARCDGGDKPSMKKKKAKSKDFKVEPTGKEDLEDVVDDEEDGQLDDFPELAPNRIVLKRACHVSDASSSSDESNSNDGE